MGKRRRAEQRAVRVGDGGDGLEEVEEMEEEEMESCQRQDRHLHQQCVTSAMLLIQLYFCFESTFFILIDE